MDKKKQAVVDINNYEHFCQEYQVPFKADFKRMSTKKNEEEKGEIIEVEGNEFELIPGRDYFRGVPTILNSEAAAVAQAHKLFNEIPKDK